MVRTRSQLKNQLEMVAQTAPLRETREIFALSELISFIEIALVNPEHGAAITHLSVVLKTSSMQRDALQTLLPACLSLTQNVIILELYISPPIPLASSVRLPFVEVLKSNLPHRALSGFIAAHPSLRALEIKACGRTRKCTLSSNNLHHINDIRCPAECAPHFVHGGIDRLRLDLVSAETSASKIISGFPIALNALYVLTLEFNAVDTSILRTIATNMPWVRNLKLIEKRDLEVSTHALRPWARSLAWSSSLHQMYDLEQLVIRTAGPLKPKTVPGDRVLERDILRRWVRNHSTLRFVAVWQHGYDHDGGVLVEWSREDGTWSGRWTKGPDPAHVMTYH